MEVYYALIDMPLEELKRYNGISPRPRDFDDYWDKALKELDMCSLDYTLEKAEFQIPGVECYHLYFTGLGGAKVHCKFLKPSNMTGKIPAVAMFHGYQGHSGDWFDKLPDYAHEVYPQYQEQTLLLMKSL